MTEKKLLCPLCREVLVPSTNPEHALLGRWQCKSEHCPTHWGGINWNLNGDTYSSDYMKSKALENSGAFIDNNAPFGTIGRELNVTIFKHDEDYYLGTLFGWRLKVEFKYKSNTNGEILSRKRELIFIKPDNTYYVSGLHMLFYTIKNYYREINLSNLDGSSPFEIPKKGSWKAKKWWRRLAPVILRILNPREYKKSLTDNSKPV